MVTANYAYLSAAGDNQIVQSTGTGILYGFTVGNSGVNLELSDSATNGAANLIISLTSPATGYYPLNVRYLNGIALNLTNAGQVTVLYGP